nr:hypothetical protein GCM10020092_024530 [Actinoplanes digitatis]
MAGLPALPALRTVADRVTVSVSTGAAGENDMAEMVRSGFGAGTPMTWNSATWPLGAPVLAVKLSRTSAAVALTGTVTVLPVAGLNVYVADGTSVVKPEALCSRPRIENVCVRVPHSVAGLSLTTTELVVALAPSETVSVAG